MADIVGLQCTVCKHRNYVTLVNKKKATKKLEKKIDMLEKKIDDLNK